MYGTWKSIVRKHAGKKQNTSGDDSKPYERHSMHYGDFRLLRLQPSKDYDSPIHCDMEVRSLQSEGLAYDALSYTWGPPTGDEESRPRETVFCQRRTPIRENLFFALCQLRHQSSVRVLWVDALCIDQDNKLEKSEQVGLMSIIYSKATRVIVWLGVDSGQYDGFVSLAFLTSLYEFRAELRQIYNTAFPDLIPENVSRVLLANGSKLRAALRTLSLGYDDPCSFEQAIWADVDGEYQHIINHGGPEVAFAWQSLIRLLASHYFSRLWVSMLVEDSIEIWFH